MAEQVKMEGFDFCFDPAACSGCGGKCCRGEPGHIWVSAAEIERMASHLRTNTVDFTATCLRRVGNRLSLRERKTATEHVCLFFDEQTGRCTIYAVRPVQCRLFPFWDYYKKCREAVMRECPGVRPCRPVDLGMERKADGGSGPGQ